MDAPPFTDWQNDLHLNMGVAHGLFRFALFDLVILKAAVTRYFSGTVSIGSCEDRSGYVYCRVPHKPTLHPAYCHGLPLRFAGRAFLCRGRGEPHRCGRDVLRAGRLGSRLGRR